MVTASVKIIGLKETVRAISFVDKEINHRLRDGFRGIAMSIAAKAANKVPRRTGKAAGSIKVRASERGAGIAVGGTAAPYFPWLDFGGSVGRHKSVKRAFIKEGRYIYPTIKEEGPAIRQTAETLIDKAKSEAGF